MSHRERAARAGWRGPGPWGLLALLLAVAPAAAQDALKGEAKARFAQVEQTLEDWDIVAARRELTGLELYFSGSSSSRH